MTERNREIDLYRILFALIVVVVHSQGLKPPDPARYPFCGGYLAVEFFFMLTGFFATRKAEHLGNGKQIAYKAIVWTGKKFLRLYQYVVPAVIFHYFVSAWLQKISGIETMKQLLYGIFEMLLLPATGIYETFLVAPLWYLSALLLTLPLFYYVVMYQKDGSFLLTASLSVLLIYGYFSVSYGHLDIWSEWTGLFFLSLPRAWAGLCLGGLCYYLTENLRRVSFSKRGLVTLRVIKILCITGTLFYMLTRRHRRMDFLCVGALFLVLALAIVLSKPIKNGSGLLAELSLSLYVCHWTVRAIILAIMPRAGYVERLGAYLLISLLYAGGLAAGVNAIRKLPLMERLKRYFLLQESQ